MYRYMSYMMGGFAGPGVFISWFISLLFIVLLVLGIVALIRYLGKEK